MRVALVPVPEGRIAGLSVFKDKLIYLRLDPYVANNDEPPTNAALHMFNLEKREEKEIVSKIRPGMQCRRTAGRSCTGQRMRSAWSKRSRGRRRATERSPPTR